MSIRFMFTQMEIEFLEFLYQTGWKNQGRDAERQDLSGWEKTALQLQNKGIVSRRGDSICIDSLIMALFDSMNKAEEIVHFQGNSLYLNRKLIVWKSVDWRSVGGCSLTPYPGVREWYEEEKENISLDKEQIDEVMKWEEEKY